MKKQKKYKICRGLFFLVFLMEISGRLAFWGMAAEKESAETQTGAAGAYYEEDAFTVLLETEYAEKKVSLKEAFHWCPEYLQGLRVKEALFNRRRSRGFYRRKSQRTVSGLFRD